MSKNETWEQGMQILGEEGNFSLRKFTKHSLYHWAATAVYEGRVKGRGTEDTEELSDLSDLIG